MVLAEGQPDTIQYCVCPPGGQAMCVACIRRHYKDITWLLEYTRNI